MKKSSSRKISDWWYRWWVNTEKSWLKLQNLAVSAISGRVPFWDLVLEEDQEPLSFISHSCMFESAQWNSGQSSSPFSYCFLSSSWHLKIQLMLLMSSIWWADVTHVLQIFSEGWAHEPNAAVMIARLQRASLVAQRWRIFLPMQEAWVQPLGQEYPLEKKMITHSCILAWRISWTEEPGRLWSTRS